MVRFYMVKSREDLVKWSLRKAEEYLESARQNLDENRLFPAAEEIFRSVETTLEALLYHFGTRKIEYPGKVKKFTGRLALQYRERNMTGIWRWRPSFIWQDMIMVAYFLNESLNET